MAADEEFGNEQRDSEYEYAYQIDYQKGTAAAFAGNVWESPDVSQSDGASDRYQYGTELAAEFRSIVCHLTREFFETEYRFLRFDDKYKQKNPKTDVPEPDGRQAE